MADLAEIEMHEDVESDGVGLLIPHEAIVAWFEFGGTLAKSAANLANEAAGGSVGGAPDVSPYWLGFKSVTTAKYIDSGVANGAEGTIFVVARSNNTLSGAEAKPVFAATWQIASSVNTGIALIGDVASSIEGIHLKAFFDDGLGGKTELTASMARTLEQRSAFRLYAFRWKTGVGITLFDLTAGTKAEAPSALTFTPPARNWRLGSTYSSTSRYGTCEECEAVIADEYLAEADIVMIGQQIREMCAAVGITGL